MIILSLTGAIFHSDRGSNYTSRQFAETLKKYNIRQSVGRTGICYDNAMAESFFAALKNQRVHRTQYPTREHARRDIVRYIEFRHNLKRPGTSGFSTGPRSKSTRNTWNGSPQRELTTNPLSGKLEADQANPHPRPHSRPHASVRPPHTLRSRPRSPRPGRSRPRSPRSHRPATSGALLNFPSLSAPSVSDLPVFKGENRWKDEPGRPGRQLPIGYHHFRVRFARIIPT